VYFISNGSVIWPQEIFSASSKLLCLKSGGIKARYSGQILMVKRTAYSEIIDPLEEKINYDDEGLIRPRKRKTDPSAGPDTLLVMVPSDIDGLIKALSQEGLSHSYLDFFTLYQMKEGAEPRFSFAGPFLGAPQAVMGLEKLIVLGARRIWVLGWCGSLQPHLRIGDMVIPTRAISEEGTSTHYPLGDRPAKTDEALNSMLETQLNNKGHAYSKGMIWTTDAPYRETFGKVRRYQSSGVLAVEMEMSALMTVAAFRGVSLAALLLVSDELFDLKWHHGFSSPRLEKSCRVAREILIHILTDDLGATGSSTTSQ
jgi:uridine phosphorylase